MKKTYCLLLSVLSIFTSTSLFAQEDPFTSDFLERFQNSKSYLVEVAEKMPEEKYHYKATPESLSFAENLMHIGFALNWHSKTLLAGIETPSWQEDTRYKVGTRSKAEMIEIVE